MGSDVPGGGFRTGDGGEDTKRKNRAQRGGNPCQQKVGFAVKANSAKGKPKPQILKANAVQLANKKLNP